MRSDALKVGCNVPATPSSYRGLAHVSPARASLLVAHLDLGAEVSASRIPPDAPRRPPYSALADVYDAIMQDVPYRSWCRFVLTQLAQRGWRGERVLDLGCGTGRAGTEYRDHGLAVLGVDPSAAMVRAARRRDPEGHYAVADARTLSLGRRFDLVIAVFDALNNLTGDGELAAACERVLAHLEPGGAFVFDVNTSVGLRSLWEDDVAEGWADEVFYRWEHSWDAQAGRARVAAYCRGPAGAFVEYHEERPFDPPELEAVLASAGFAPVELVRYPRGEPCEEGDPRVWVIARRPA